MGEQLAREKNCNTVSQEGSPDVCGNASSKAEGGDGSLRVEKHRNYVIRAKGIATQKRFVLLLYSEDSEVDDGYVDAQAEAYAGIQGEAKIDGGLSEHAGLLCWV